MHSSQTLIQIVIADDEAAIRNGLQKIVSIDQFNIQIVGTADNGKKALSLIQQHQPDIAIIDINMPEMDGLEVIRLSTENKLKTRFLILSGYDDFSYAQTAICYGVKYYFLKPLNIAEFRKQFIIQCEEVLTTRQGAASLSGDNINTVISSSRIMFLNQMIQGKLYHSEHMISRLSEVYLTLTDSSCCVLILRFSCLPADYLPDLQEINEIYVKPAFSGYSMESWVYDDHQIIALFNLSDDRDPLFRHVLRECLNHMRSSLNCTVMAGIGTVVHSLKQCQDSFLKAQEAMTYHIYRKDADIFDSHLISEKVPTFSKDNIDLKPLIHSILQSNTEGIKEYCSFFFQSLFFIKMPPPNFLFGMCMYLVMQVQKQLALMYPDQKLSIDTEIEEASSFDSVQYLNNWLIGIFLRYSGIIRSIHADSNEIIRKAKEYIQNNLHHNIKVKDVAAYINLSESYFAIYFKEKTGINFRDYLLSVKMEYAKKLLNSKKSSIEEIASLAGYQDYRSFSRAFKNETGMTPSDYCNRSDS
jgi:Response regulator containing CheY-like receiver domain and AraC-type DNA-binding domain